MGLPHKATRISMHGTELHTILSAGQKKTPHGTEINISLGRIPGTVSVRLQLPGQAGWSEFADLPIDEGVLTLPWRLAFLAHVKEDRDFVAELSKRLLCDGVLTWFDEKDLLPGDDWQLRIGTALQSSDFILVVLSKRSVSKTGYFQAELKHAVELCSLRPEGTRYLIPIMVDDCDPPRSVSRLHWLRVDQHGWYERLLRSLQSEVANCTKAC